MIAATDVQYFDSGARAAAVLFADWPYESPFDEWTAWLDSVEPYESGSFYKRELPCLLAVLQPILYDITLVVVDGYVWLGDETRPGLGARLFEALGGEVPVVGIAKTGFTGAAPVAEVLRGTSVKPLYVSAVGVPLDDAANAVRAMHGAHRLPTLLHRVDSLARGRA